MAKRPKRPKTKSKFSVKENKLSTILGVALGIISIITVLLLVYLTFRRGGEASVSFAFAGLLASVFSLVGFLLSFLCVNDHYQHHWLGWIGMLTNGVGLATMAGILYLGML